jgi:hypothetical protein
MATHITIAGAESAAPGSSFFYSFGLDVVLGSAAHQCLDLTGALPDDDASFNI